MKKLLLIGAAFAVLLAPAGASAFGESRTNIGFAVGGGIEDKCSYLLPPGWTWKLEYLYVDLGSLDTMASFPGALPASQNSISPFTGAIATHTRFTDNVVRVGLLCRRSRRSTNELIARV